MTGKADKSYHPIRQWIVPALLAFAGCVSLPWMLRLDGRELMFTNSVFSVAVFAVLLILIRKALLHFSLQQRRQWAIAGCLSFLFAAGMAFGSSLDETGSIPFNDGIMWLAVLIWGAIITLAVLLSWKKLNDYKENKIKKNKINDNDSTKTITKMTEINENSKINRISKINKISEINVAAGIRFDKLSDSRQMLYMAAFIFLCWLPVFLAVYPGFFVYDAWDEYMQVATGDYSNHHPLIHVLLLGKIIQTVYQITGSYNLGIASYTLLQMLTLSVIFSGTVLAMRHRKIALPTRLFTLLYIGLFPVIVMFALCSAKDGIFTAFFLVLFIAVKNLCEKPEIFLSSKRKQLLFILGAVGVMLFRHNGKYAFWVFVLITLIYCGRQRKRVLVLFTASLVLYVMISGGLGQIYNARQGGRQEILTVPIQQLARVHENARESVESQDLEVLYRYLPKEALERYTPKVSDGVKVDFDNIAFTEDPTTFLKLWLKWGIKNPFTYLNAWFMTSYGYWYPDTIIDVYRGNTLFTHTYEDSSYFGYEVEQPGSRESKIPWLNELYRRMSLEITQQKIPVISMLFAPGFIFWIMMYTMGYLWKEKKYGQLIPWLLPLLLWLTVILGPTYLTRYVVFLWVLLPEMLISLLDVSDASHSGA